MSNHVVCPNCGARNAVGAPWCGQCYRPLREDDEDTATTVRAAANGPQLSMDLPLPEAPRIGKETWVCSVCGVANPLTESICAACGTSIFEAFNTDTKERPDARTALVRGFLLPGLGHGFAGQAILGLSIAALVFVAMVLGIILLVGKVVAAGLLLVLIAVGVWVVGAVDAYRWARGEESEIVLRPRVLTVIVGIVFIVLIVVAVSTQGKQ